MNKKVLKIMKTSFKKKNRKNREFNPYFLTLTVLFTVSLR